MALPNGGAVAVGEKYEDGSWKLYAVELAADSKGIDTVNYDGDSVGIGGISRSFTYGSDGAAETAHSIIVTEAKHWLLLGQGGYHGQNGLWIMKVDPVGLQTF